MKKDHRTQDFATVDERNVARLGIVSLQTRVGPETRWSSAFTVGTQSYRLEIRAADGRPRGIDTNVLIGIESLFAAHDSPRDNWLHTTAYALREASFLPNNGSSYHRLRESLLRLWSTGFIVSEGWASPSHDQIRTNVTLRLIDKIAFLDLGGDDETERLRKLVPEATLSIRIGDELARSIRAGFTQALERQLLTAIEQPPARALYRLLEAHRYTDAGRPLPELSVGLLDWRQACGIQDEKPARVLRTLCEAHEELVAQRYLAEVRIEGSRRNTSITYVFSAHQQADPHLVRLLISVGVAAPQANKLACEAPERVEDVVDYVKRQVVRRPDQLRSPAGLVVDMLNHPDKYVLEDRFSAISTSGGQASVRNTTLVDLAERAAAEAAERERVKLSGLRPHEQWEHVRSSLKVLIGKRLRQNDWARMEDACCQGVLNALEIKHEYISAQAQQKTESYMEELLSRLQSLSER
ncbi:replication initiator protein A [Deinococcus pimensis]|uniref:replication initiator protein A n=1 Tax=Deinococcus pimensis TaxID=309888 RepID=UPI0004B8DD29|nr:replication initiator protein A [Deinococcus pimensis]